MRLSAETFSGATLCGCRAAQALAVSEPQLARVALVKLDGGLRPASEIKTRVKFFPGKEHGLRCGR